MSLDRPILITGSPRAGKTLVSEIMRAGGEFFCVDEPLMMWNYGLRSSPDDRRTAAEATPEVSQRIRRDCEELLRESGKDRYMDVLSYHALRIPFIGAVLPEARIVLVIRDAEEAIPEMLFGWTAADTVGRALRRRWGALRWQGLPTAAMRFARNFVEARVRGRRSSWGPRPPGLADVLGRSDIAEVVAYQWRSMIEVALADLAERPPDTWLEIRMDRLRDNPEHELRRLVDFCEPRDPETVIRRGLEVINPNHPFEKKVVPSEDQWNLIRPQIEPLQRRLGYLSSAARTAAEEATPL